MATPERQQALFGHCVKVYNAMKDDENSQQVNTEEGNTVTLYTGFLTRLFEDLGLSVPYYTDVMGALKRMDCARQMRRGGGTSPSQWILLREPTEALYNEMILPRHMLASLNPKFEAGEQVMQMLRDLSKRLEKVEAVVYVSPE